MFGHHGRIRQIDLGSQSIDSRTVPESMLRNYLGGAGLGVRLLLDEQVEAEPTSPEAPIVLAFSALVGSPLTT